MKTKNYKKMLYELPPRHFDLRNWRENNKLSTRQLAEILQCDSGYVSRIENGKYCVQHAHAKEMFKKLEKWEQKNSPTGIYFNFADLMN